MESIQEISDKQLFLAMYPWIMSAIGLAITIILGFIASWMKKMSNDMGSIKEAMIKYETIGVEHSKEIQNLRVSNDHQWKKINEIEVSVASINKNGK